MAVSLTRASADRFKADNAGADPLRGHRRLAAAVLVKALRDKDTGFFSPGFDLAFWLQFLPDHPPNAQKRLLAAVGNLPRVGRRRKSPQVAPHATNGK